FAVGLAISTIALGWKSGQFVADLALAEAVHDGHLGSGGNWVRNVERRLTAEESRNTNIEDFARETRDRADVAEARADEAERREQEK
ncbi:MAG TPA: hypothetical protein VFY54_05135, partial [Rubrobacter sp.]|nr:hypothetical protein [Rubrobacter sp.]